MESRYLGVIVMIVMMLIIGYYVMSLLADRKNVTFNLGKAYMILLMALAGGAVEVALMAPRGPRKVLAGGLLAAASLWLALAVRGQYYIRETEFLKVMIEHHGMAVVMSRRLLEKTTRKDVAMLAASILRAQTSEISLMRRMLAGEQSLRRVRATLRSGCPP